MPDYLFVCYRVRDLAMPNEPSLMAQCCDCRATVWAPIKIDFSREALLIMKTKKSHFKKIVETVKALHSYDTPEVIALPIVEGSKDYLGWVNKSVR